MRISSLRVNELTADSPRTILRPGPPSRARIPSRRFKSSAAPTRRSRPRLAKASSRPTAPCGLAAGCLRRPAACQPRHDPDLRTVLNGITIVSSIVGTRTDLREVFQPVQVARSVWPVVAVTSRSSITAGGVTPLSECEHRLNMTTQHHTSSRLSQERRLRRTRAVRGVHQSGDTPSLNAAEHKPSR
jgi:hypothetical protein